MLDGQHAYTKQLHKRQTRFRLRYWTQLAKGNAAGFKPYQA